MPTGVPLKLTPEVLERIEDMAAHGCTQEQIAHNLGIHPGTLSKNKQSVETLRQAIERGQAKGIEQIQSKLFENADSGNLGAQCFYLRNRAPDQWMDRQDIRVQGSMKFEVIDYTGDEPDDWDDEEDAA